MFTLQIRGELHAPNGDPELQRELDKHIPYEYVLSWLSSREGFTGPENRFLALQSGTSSGKSITIPSRIYIDLMRPRFVTGGSLICTQPRVLTTIANARKIAEIPAFAPYLKIGETIGWNTQLFKEKPKNVGVLFATIGVLSLQLQVLTDSELMATYRYIIIDEAHERALGVDTALTALKAFLRRNAQNPHCPFVIVMSATFNPFEFASFFLNTPDHKRSVDELTKNIIICSSASSKPREFIWPEAPITDIIAEIMRIIRNIVTEQPAPIASWNPKSPEQPQSARDDILVFLPGLNEITKIYGEIDQLTRELKPLYAVRLDSTAVNDSTQEYTDLDIELRSINERDNTMYERRVILSTAVAETGKTFTGVKYVIDAGYSREVDYNPITRTEILISRPASKARITQRWGRVGRTFPGVVYPLYTRELHEKLPDEQYPEIINANITRSILQLINDQQRTKLLRGDYPAFRIEDLDLMSMPHWDSLLDAIDRVRSMGFIALGAPMYAIERDEFMRGTEYMREDTLGITKIGRIAIELALDFERLEYLRLILAGFAWNYRPYELILISIFEKLKFSDKTGRYDFDMIYSLIFKDSISGNAYANVRTLLGDTFFNAIVIGYVLDQKESNIVMLANIGLSIESIATFKAAQNKIANLFIRMGFNIYEGRSIYDDIKSGNISDIAESIIAYKRCLLDAFRVYYVRRTATSDNKFVTNTGLTIEPTFLEKIYGGAITNAKEFLFSSFDGVQDKKTLYNVSAKFVTILDGFVGYDPLFTH